MVLQKLSIVIFLVLLFNSNSVCSQTDAEKESEIVNLIIAFQNNRFSDKEKAESDINKAIEIAKTTEKQNNLVSTKILLGELYDVLRFLLHLDL